MLCCLGHSNYSGSFFHPPVVEPKVESVPEIRAMDKGVVSLKVEIPYEVMHSDNVRNLQKEAVTSQMLIGQVDDTLQPVKHPYKVPVSPERLHRR